MQRKEKFVGKIMFLAESNIYVISIFVHNIKIYTFKKRQCLSNKNSR